MLVISAFMAGWAAHAHIDRCRYIKYQPQIESTL